MSLLPLCKWLEQTQWSIALHESLWVYPIVESIHVLTLCLFLGTAVLLDLRLMGIAMTRTPFSQFTAHLLPWTVGGFAVMALSGGLLFYAIPVRTYLNIFFRIKAAMLLAAGINAWIFHATVFRKLPEWDQSERPPKAARLAGAVSLAAWAIVVVAGRMIAYNWFDPPDSH